jgi:predicted RNA-binding protein (TIGR00451 family)
MKEVDDFAEKLGCKISLRGNKIINKNGKVFLVNKKIFEYSKKKFFYAGLFLGNIKKGKIDPSLYLLSLLSKNKANKVIVDNKTAWLVIYGRNILKNGILGVEGSLQKGDIVLILNSYGDCLGLGKIVFDFDKKSKENEVIVKNLFDIGDFLRREK